MDSLNMLPGHKERMNELFKIVETLNPKAKLKQNLMSVLRQSRDEKSLKGLDNNQRHTLSSETHDRKKERQIYG